MKESATIANKKLEEHKNECCTFRRPLFYKSDHKHKQPGGKPDAGTVSAVACNAYCSNHSLPKITLASCEVMLLIPNPNNIVRLSLLVRVCASKAGNHCDLCNFLGSRYNDDGVHLAELSVAVN
jgi:hypothetical protein